MNAGTRAKRKIEQTGEARSNQPDPLSIKAEENVFRSMLHVDGAKAREIVGHILTGKDFYHKYSQDFFEAIMERHDATLPVEDFSAASYQKIAKRSPKIGSMAAIHYFEELRATAISGSPENAAYYAGIVREKSQVRKYRKELSKTLKDISSDQSITPGQIKDRLTDAIALIGPGTETKELDTEPGLEDNALFDLDTYLPREGMLKNYVDYALPLTEAPAVFHLFSALVMLATVVGKRAHWVVADRKKYCNLWVVLAGRSGCKKSTCINTVKHILANTGLKDVILPEQITPEKLIEVLANRPDDLLGKESSVGTFFWSEWGAAMDQWQKSYSGDMMSILTGLYDGEYFSRWLRSEKYEIYDSSISVLSGCTLAWLKKTVQRIDVSMGFWPRCLFIPALRREKYLANPPKGDQGLREKIQEDLKFLTDNLKTKSEREINFQMVDDMYKSWYEEANRTADQDAAHPYMSAFIVRLSDCIKKISALIEISVSGSVDVTVDTMVCTLKLADWLKESYLHIMSQLTQGEMSEIEQMIYEVILQAGNGGINHTELRRQLQSYSKTDVEIAVISLEDSETIRIIREEKTGRGRRATKYVTL